MPQRFGWPRWKRLLTAMPSEEDLAKMVKQLQTAEERHRRKLGEFEGREAKYQSIDRELEIANARYETRVEGIEIGAAWPRRYRFGS